MNKKVMIASWPGIGVVGSNAVDALRRQVKAEEFSTLRDELKGFMFPDELIFKDGLICDLAYPGVKFWECKKPNIIFVLGETQHMADQQLHAMARVVVEVASKLGCKEIYTAGAYVSKIHHEVTPRVAFLVNDKDMIPRLTKYTNTFMIPDEIITTGLNGLVLYAAKEKGISSAFLMGEIPDYLAGVPMGNPKSSLSVLKLFQEMFSLPSTDVMDEDIKSCNDAICGIYEQMPPVVRAAIDKRKPDTQENISDEEVDYMKNHLSDLFHGTEESQ